MIGEETTPVASMTVLMCVHVSSMNRETAWRLIVHQVKQKPNSEEGSGTCLEHRHEASIKADAGEPGNSTPG